MELGSKYRKNGAIFAVPPIAMPNFVIFATKFNMEKKTHIGLWVLAAMLSLAVASCCKQDIYAGSPIVGHWGCEEYISCRTNDDGSEKWDTLYYEVGEGHGYEVYFYADGTGKLLLNDSPALIKKFDCDFDFDSVNRVLTIYNTSWILSMFTDATSADMDIEELTATSIRASWMNYFSEPTPFFERFFLKRID